MHATLRAIGGAAALFLGALATPAMADVTVYYHVGGWDAFSGPGSDGQPVCGVGNTNPLDHRAFSIRFAIGSPSVTFEARKPNWNIPGGTPVQVVMQVGLETPWSLQGNGDGQTVQWLLDRNAMQAFDAQFRRASSMSITFPSGNEPPWTIGLAGSTAISNAFGRCVTDMRERATGQPQAAPPAADQGPTQPFTPAPADSTPPPAAAQPPAH